MKDVFIRLHRDAFKYGLFRSLGDRLWATLCVLAFHMDEDGKCYPTQQQIADALGISRTRANIRVKELLEFRFNGKPLVEVVPDERRNNTYRVLPLAQFAIFGGEVEPLDMLQKRNTSSDMLQERNTDMLRKRKTNMLQKRNTNYNHNNNNQYNNKDTGDKPSEPLPVEKLKNASDVVKYFCKKYREAYDVPYNPNFSRDASMVKNKLVKTYTMEQIKAMIDVTFEQYDQAWATQGYPRPTIGQLCTWIPNKAFAVLQAREKKQADIKKQMEAPTPTAEDLIAELERGLG